MAFKPGMHENILFPVPYAENEQHPLIITNKRVVQRSDAGEVEMATDDIHFVGRHTVRPRMPLGVMLLVFALPLLGFGLYKFYDVWGMTAASPLSLVSASADDSATQVPTEATADGEEAPESGPKEVLVARIVGGVCLLLALGCAIGARALIRKKQFFVTAKGNKRLLKMEVKDEIQQTQVMVTVSAVKGKAKAS
jgi:hypothetical protein